MAQIIPQKISKNARREIIKEKFFCDCGGEIKMIAKFQGKMKMIAQCNKCGEERRKLSEFPNRSRSKT